MARYQYLTSKSESWLIILDHEKKSAVLHVRSSKVPAWSEHDYRAWADCIVEENWVTHSKCQARKFLRRREFTVQEPFA